MGKRELLLDDDPGELPAIKINEEYARRFEVCVRPVQLPNNYPAHSETMHTCYSGAGSGMALLMLLLLLLLLLPLLLPSTAAAAALPPPTHSHHSTTSVGRSCIGCRRSTPK
jgi:hypothetical protein